MQNGAASSQQSSFNSVRQHLIVALPNNFDADDLAELEERVLESLSANKRIRGVIVDFAAVHSTDPADLERLNDCLRAVRLLGRRVALCGINPGVAAVVVRSGLHLHRERVGVDIDDVLQSLNDA